MIVIKRDDGTEYRIDASKSCVICGELYPLYVGVDYKTVKGAIRKNRNQPVTICHDND